MKPLAVMGAHFTMSSAGKGKSWLARKTVCFVDVYLFVSEDSVKGTDMKNASSWAQFLELCHYCRQGIWHQDRQRELEVWKDEKTVGLKCLLRILDTVSSRERPPRS